MMAIPAETTAPRWRTMLFDGLGLMAVIWSIPIAIVVIGAPIVFLARFVLMLARMILNAS
jgi:hypothetical protein